MEGPVDTAQLREDWLSAARGLRKAKFIEASRGASVPDPLTDGPKGKTG